MTCRNRDLALLLHAHGQLGALGRVLLGAHLKGCASCRHRWSRAVMERDGLRRAMTPPEDQGGLADRQMNAVAVRIRTEPRETSVRPSAARPAAVPWPRNAAFLVAVSLLLALALSAMATFWGPFSTVRPSGGGKTCPVLSAGGPAPPGQLFKSVPPANQACYRCHVDLEHPNLLRK